MIFAASACGGSSNDGQGAPSATAEVPQATATTSAGEDRALILSTQDLMDLLVSSVAPVQVVDARAAEEWDIGHVPGAISIPAASLAVTLDGIPNMAADPAMLAAAFGAAGLSRDVAAVVYDGDGGKVASRLFWLLEYMGHEDVRFLDGGLSAWAADGQVLQTRAESEPAAATTYPLNPNLELIASGESIESGLGDSSIALIDARTRAEYAGTDVRASRGGHIPGAAHRDWMAHFGADGLMLSLDELRDYYGDTGVFAADQVVVYCQSGQRATHTYLALRSLGLENVKLYDASWEEWGNSEMPVETGVAMVDGAPDCNVLGEDWLVEAVLRECDFAGEDFSGANLKGANLMGADLSLGRFRESNLSGANLSGAQLRRANFTTADFGRANLTGASLVGANLTDAHFHFAIVDGVEWGDTKCPDGTNSDENGGTCEGHLDIEYEPEADPCG